MGFFDLHSFEKWLGTLFLSALGTYDDGISLYVVEVRRTLLRTDTRTRFRTDKKNNSPFEVIQKLNDTCDLRKKIIVMSIYPDKMISRTIQLHQPNPAAALEYIKSVEDNLRHGMRQKEKLLSTYALIPDSGKQTALMFYQVFVEREFTFPGDTVSEEKLHVHLIPGLRELPLGDTENSTALHCFIVESSDALELIIKAKRRILFHQIVPGYLLPESKAKEARIFFLQSMFSRELRLIGVDLNTTRTTWLNTSPDHDEETQYQIAASVATAVLQPGNQYSGHRFPFDVFLQKRSENVALWLSSAILVFLAFTTLLIYLGFSYTRNNLSTELDGIEFQNLQWIKLNARINQIETRHQYADSLQDARFRMSVYLRRIARLMPDNSWLTQLKYSDDADSENRLFLEGFVRDSQCMKDIFSGLKNAGFTGIRLEYLGPSSPGAIPGWTLHPGPDLMRFILVAGI